MFGLEILCMDATLTENVFTDAALIMGLGMTTIFVILMLIVWIGRALIRLVNHYSPVPESPAQIESIETNTISPKTVAAIVSTVAYVTGQKGKITHIEKVN